MLQKLNSRNLSQRDMAALQSKMTAYDVIISEMNDQQMLCRSNNVWWSTSLHEYTPSEKCQKDTSSQKCFIPLGSNSAINGTCRCDLVEEWIDDK
ncbi:uncharacterized protein TNCV_2153781 [Trichonephila clavipes]|nr:uncharacterized protein TNCV_2153781 [Trichonephila clavipes]